MSLTTLLCVGAGGAVGALCRHKASTFMKPRFIGDFPWPTLFINMASCFVAGFLLAVSLHMNQTFATALTMGFLGGFSTLSTMNCEAVDLILGGKVACGVAYLAATYVVTLGLAAAGFALAAAL